MDDSATPQTSEAGEYITGKAMDKKYQNSERKGNGIQHIERKPEKKKTKGIGRSKNDVWNKRITERIKNERHEHGRKLAKNAQTRKKVRKMRTRKEDKKKIK